MFGNKKRDKRIQSIEKSLTELSYYFKFQVEIKDNGDVDVFTGNSGNIMDKLKALEEYLGIEYVDKIESTKGYVKKEVIGFTERQKELLNRIAGNTGSGRKSNNKKK